MNPDKTYPKNCIVCKDVFEPVNPNTKCCKLDCVKKYFLHHILYNPPKFKYDSRYRSELNDLKMEFAEESITKEEFIMKKESLRLRYGNQELNA